MYRLKKNNCNFTKSYHPITMNDTVNTALQLWQDNRERLSHIDNTLPEVEYNALMALCEKIHLSLKSATDCEDYIAFLSAYANLLAIREENLEKELQVQEEIIALRRNQVEGDRALYLPKLANSLLFAALIHQRLTNVRQALEYMEESVSCEREAVEELGVSSLQQLAVKRYYWARMCATTGRNILAEDAYKDAIADYNMLLSNPACNRNETTVTLGYILIELADFYYSDRLIDNALDRYHQAIEVLLTLQDSEQAQSLIQEIYKLLSYIYELLGNVEKSNYYKELVEQ